MLVRLTILLISIFSCTANVYADVEFHCPARINVLQQGLAVYLQALKIPASQYVQTVDPQSGSLKLALKTSTTDTRTLDFYMRPEFKLSTERVRLPTAITGKQRVLNTVSRKEIVLALMQHGRVTIFQNEACSVEALSDRVGVRQNIVAWAEHLNWDWPDGGPAKWNPEYWTRGTPNPGVSLHDAVMDAFLHQEKYAMGCYTATKMVIVQGMLDYYSRVKHDQQRTIRVEKELLSDGDPLVGIEPGRMWNFETDFDPKQMGKDGKLLNLFSSVASGNFIPGDWGYILNTDPISEQKTGYEGSNAIYLGRNRFDDYYNDNNHSYTYEQKLDEVYQWRNGVFSRIRDANKVKRLPEAEQASLGNTPDSGGLQLDIRAVPKYF